MADIGEAPVGQVQVPDQTQGLHTCSMLLYERPAQLHHQVPLSACAVNHRLYLVQVVSPGQILFKLPLAGAVRVGPGLQVEGDCLITTKSGILRKTKAGKFWVEGRSKR